MSMSSSTATLQNGLLAVLYRPILPQISFSHFLDRLFPVEQVDTTAQNQLLRDLQQELLDLPADVPLREALDALNHYPD